VGVIPDRIKVRDLGYRWGSCGTNRVLFFNWKGLQLPVRLLDYLLLHELTHLIEPNHSADFWRILDRALPEWKQRKEELRNKARDLFWCGVISDG
jgi:predicted metal-dependent hydrolase